MKIQTFVHNRRGSFGWPGGSGNQYRQRKPRFDPATCSVEGCHGKALYKFFKDGFCKNHKSLAVKQFTVLADQKDGRVWGKVEHGYERWDRETKRNEQLRRLKKGQNRFK